MITSNLSPRQWHYFLFFSGICGIFISLFIFLFEKQYNFISILNLCLFAVGLSYQLYCIRKKKTIANVLTCRILFDHFLFFITTFFMYKNYPFLIFLYIMATWFHLLAFFINDLDKKVLFFIKISLILTLPIFFIITYLNEKPISVMEITFSIFIILSFISIICVNKVINNNKKEKETLIEVKKIETTLLKHNFGNMASILSAFSNCDIKEIDENYSKAINNALDTIKSIISTICAEDSNVNIKVYSIIDKVFNSAKIKYNCTMVRDIDSNLIIKTNLNVFLNSILVFINNACEAGSEIIKVYIKDTRYLCIEDNGKGFDVRQIKEGHTTKLNGHGVGLINSMNILKLLNIPIDINSQVGVGTIIRIDLKNIII